MANSISAAPAVLSAGVLSTLKNKLPVLSGISTVFSARPGSSGMSLQVPLIGVSTATTFGSGGYATQDDATISAATVSLTGISWAHTGAAIAHVMAHAQAGLKTGVWGGLF